MLGGSFACWVTHVGIVPLDIVKCRRQVNPKIYKGLTDGFKTIYAKEGFRGLGVGTTATFVGYACQGVVRFALYERFKDLYASIVGPDKAEKYQTIGFLISAASAEFFADMVLCPWESLKVRVQVDTAGEFPRSFTQGTKQLWANEGIQGFYKGLTPLWMRQIPYTMVKFAVFERTVRFMYANIFTRPIEQYSAAQKLSITFLSGYWAGIFCAIVSHPGDTIVSKLNEKKTEGSSMVAIRNTIKELGFRGIWRGLTTRIIMIGSIAGLQWWIYDSFKTIFGLQTTGTEKK